MKVLNFDAKLCEGIRRQFDAYLSNELLVETTSEVVRHLESCAGCASELESRMRVRAALRRAAFRQMTPAQLSQTIHQQLRRAQRGRLAVFRNISWVWAAAAVFVLGVVGAAGQQLLKLRHAQQTVRSILALGVSDHVDCVLRGHNYPDAPRSPDELRQRVGPECAGLVGVVQEKLPGFQVLEAHVCSLPGSARKYVHFVARHREGAILSVIFTKSNGQALPRERWLAADSSAKIFEARFADMHVAGFEAKNYFGFVVAGLGRDPVLQIARALAPPARDALDQALTATEVPRGESNLSRVTKSSNRAAWSRPSPPGEGKASLGYVTLLNRGRLAFVKRGIEMRYLESHKKEGNLNRRSFILSSAAALGGLALWRFWEPVAGEARPKTSGQPKIVKIVEFSDYGARQDVVPVPKVVKSEDEWRKQLSPVSFEVTRHAATETAFTGQYWNLHDKGLFRCICCDTALFSSDTKFDSGTGWPSFWAPIAKENIEESMDLSLGMPRTAVACRRCDAHLGHVFDDGPRPTGLRYCMNSASLRFVKRA